MNFIKMYFFDKNLMQKYCDDSRAAIASFRYFVRGNIPCLWDCAKRSRTEIIYHLGNRCADYRTAADPALSMILQIHVFYLNNFF